MSNAKVQCQIKSKTQMSKIFWISKFGFENLVSNFVLRISILIFPRIKVMICPFGQLIEAIL